MRARGSGIGTPALCGTLRPAKEIDAIKLLIVTVAAVVGLFIIIWAATLAFGGFAITFVGAHMLFDLAAEQGFVGIAAYVACWVFLFPLMLIASLVLGLIDFKWGDRIRQKAMDDHVRDAKERGERDLVLKAAQLQACRKASD